MKSPKALNSKYYGLRKGSCRCVYSKSAKSYEASGSGLSLSAKVKTPGNNFRYATCFLKFVRL